ncbi:MAG: ABC transporter substrate-binding protein [Pannonibacter phragmitetus]
MPLRRRLFSTAAALAFGLLAAAGVTAQPAPPALVLAVGGEPETGFDPIAGWGSYGNPLFQSTLLKLDTDLNLVGDLATSWALSDDRKTWTLTLREDAKLPDGTGLTAEDAAFTYNTVRDAGGVVDLTNLREARATGPYTLEIELKEPQITFTSRLASLGIVPKAAYGPDYARKPIGSGPFQLVEWREGEQLVAEPNPHWYGTKPGFSRVSFIFGSEDAAVSLARTGAAQLVAVPSSLVDETPQGMKSLHVKTVDNRGVMFPMVPDTGAKTDEGYPIGNSVTSDKAIRVALNEALDRQALVDLALSGHGRPAYGPADGLPWDNANANVMGVDIEAARATLTAGGWRDSNGDGVLEKDGKDAAFTLLYPASDSTRQALTLGVVEQAKAIGIRITPQGKSWTEIRTLMHANAVLFGFGSHSPAEMVRLNGSRYAGAGYYNPGYYNSPAVDAAFAKAESAESFEASLPFWQAAQWDGTTGFGSKGDAAWAWLVNLEHSYWVSDCLDTGRQQIQPHGHGFPITRNLEDWRWTCK